ncbi:ComEC/Rec2 family competence protein [Candidatus Saccharibacteria bacterium]|nr:ComEC/Rec2 family competence protein [Candidatus Saccharibacteria bacterium]
MLLKIRTKLKEFFWRGIHQSWGVVMMCVGVIIGMILGVIFRINYFWSPVWVVFVILLFVFMYLKPRFLTVSMCLVAGMVLAFFKVAVVLSDGGDTKLGVDEGTEGLVISARDWFSGRIESVLPERKAGLSMSYLLGMKTGIDKELSENLKAVGLAHIVVASGAHLSILVEIARKIFGKISRFSGLLFSILFILFFMCMVGWTPSILRAGMMAILTLLSWYVGRKIAPWRIILIVAAFTLMLNPLFLTNLGWLLSFASYAGIMMLGPSIIRFFYGAKKPGFIASTVLTTVAATLMTLPITLYYFGQISLISVVANILILPTLPYVMGLTFLTGIFAGVPGVSVVMGFLTERMLNFHIVVVEWFGEMEQFLIKIDRYEPRVFLLYLILLVPILWRGWRKLKSYF